ncbi:secreted lipase [Penicillium odoratum]|uniref:secreted lipase n=1 Tax=Penicillium odoratum TaxID=1167516 RepID=UPI0025470548|nr:secreted lipase [Penicillium odoratum]KAJ5768775.1 secreted lipase [Penicillium odoratum]
MLIHLFLVVPILAAPFDRRASAPTVTISTPEATIIGSTSSNIDTFNGIPFSLAPTGARRLKPPQAIATSLGKVEATGTAMGCPQFYFTTSTSDFPVSILGDIADIPLFQTVTNAGEDCLNLNVQRPSGTTAGAGLPVLVWIFGGGFELGSTSMYDGSSIVASSVTLDMPVIFVAMNYRVGGFGFMPGSEILKDGSANLGLLDQRLALEWVADNIEVFGGDPSKVTIWGESAGAISVFDQMALYDGDITYNGSPLFRGAIMDSGSVVPADPVDGVKGQAVYDAVVKDAGCSGATDTLECLRDLDYTTFLNAVNSVPGILSYNSIALSYLPRPDGTVLTESPEILVESGKYASVPFIIGDQEDEGTIFALFQSNITTETEIVDYLQDLFFADASRTQLEDLVATYQTITTDGSPFRTGVLNNWYGQYKRLAAILGDLTFTLTRRLFLTVANQVKPDVPSWSYLSSYDYGTLLLGTFHASDLLQVFYGILPNYASKSTHSYYLSFVYDLDPNSKATGYTEWPQWSASQTLMNIFSDYGAILADDFRSDSFDFIQANVGSFHI